MRHFPRAGPLKCLTIWPFGQTYKHTHTQRLRAKDCNNIFLLLFPSAIVLSKKVAQDPSPLAAKDCCIDWFVPTPQVQTLMAEICVSTAFFLSFFSKLLIHSISSNHCSFQKWRDTLTTWLIPQNLYCLILAGKLPRKWVASIQYWSPNHQSQWKSLEVCLSWIPPPRKNVVHNHHITRYDHRSLCFGGSLQCYHCSHRNWRVATGPHVWPNCSQHEGEIWHCSTLWQVASWRISQRYVDNQSVLFSCSQHWFSTSFAFCPIIRLQSSWSTQTHLCMIWGDGEVSWWVAGTAH